MGRSDRVDDARLLWQEGRRESGLLLACVAIAARARQDYPDARDGEAFTRVVSDALSARISVEYRGELWPIEQLLYVWVRCELVHNAAVPLDIEIDDELGDGLVLRAGDAPERIVKLSPGWFKFLISVASKSN